MSEDFIRNSNLLQGIQKAYLQISTMLYAEGFNLKDFEMDPVEISELNIENIDSENSNIIGSQQYKKLNEKQKEIVDIVLNLINHSDENSNQNRCFYIDGPGGSGKTFIYTTLWHLLRSAGRKVQMMAYTGIAATLLPHGRTVHKTLGLHVPLFIDSTSNIKMQSKEAKILLETDVFIWDEAPMAPRYALEVIDRLLRNITNKNTPFGNKIVILGGNFRQLLPIQQFSTRSELINLSIKFSPLWKCFRTISLTQNMRVINGEIEFSKFLLDIGNGTMNDENDNIELPVCFVAPPNADIVDDIYAANCAILSARNVDVDEINRKVIELLNPMTERIYTSVNSAQNCDDNGAMSEALLPEYLNSLLPSNLPPHKLSLRVNSVVMLIRNLSIHEGLCNGT
ncbi:uncharacterized protein LOC141525698 [Cotesia typhae]|uniref:uncharacterized protein LOC141525698 n=1 Tax=Cotesia typhae TaxID=2053667 RepID=UPI003D6972FD